MAADDPKLTGRGVLVWRERESEPHTFDLVDQESGEIFEGYAEDTIFDGLGFG